MEEQHESGKPQQTIQFAPVPLVTGNAIADAHGGLRDVAAVEVTVRLSDGDVETIGLDYRFGGWWAPATTSPQH